MALLGSKGKIGGILVPDQEEPNCLDRFVIPSNSIFSQTWKVFALFLSMTSSFHYAFAAAFFLDISEEEKEYFLLFDLVYNIIFAADLLLNFWFALYNPSADKDEDRFPVIAEAYLRGRFLTDFITVLPMYRLFSFARHARLLFLLKLTRLYRGIQLLDTAVIL